MKSLWIVTVWVGPWSEVVLDSHWVTQWSEVVLDSCLSSTPPLFLEKTTV